MPGPTLAANQTQPWGLMNFLAKTTDANTFGTPNQQFTPPNQQFTVTVNLLTALYYTVE